MLKTLVKIANNLDRRGLQSEADMVDSFINKNLLPNEEKNRSFYERSWPPLEKAMMEDYVGSDQASLISQNVTLPTKQPNMIPYWDMVGGFLYLMNDRSGNWNLRKEVRKRLGDMKTLGPIENLVRNPKFQIKMKGEKSGEYIASSGKEEIPKSFTFKTRVPKDRVSRGDSATIKPSILRCETVVPEATKSKAPVRFII